MTVECYLCLGSNMESRRQRIGSALGALSNILEVCDQSPLIESEDYTGRGGKYLNTVVRCRTNAPIEKLQQLLANIEKQGGRTPQSKSCGLMPIDIDIVIYDGRIICPHDYNMPFFRRCIEKIPSPEGRGDC